LSLLQAALAKLDRVEDLLPLLARDQRASPWVEVSKLFARTASVSNFSTPTAR
jgi:hypothetical protein